MEVKEAIEQVKELTDFYNYPASFRLVEQHEAWENNRKRDGIISLLQQGEKYRKIVEDIEYELNWHKPEKPLFTAKLEVSKDEEYCNEILDLIANIKQKYFPKEAKQDYPEGDE